MSKIGFFIWQVASMPAKAEDLGRLCIQYGIKILVIKIANNQWNYNVSNGDSKLKTYIDVLRSYGVEVEGWGWHETEYLDRQAAKIIERCKTFGIDTYHINAESDWKEGWGMTAAARQLLTGLEGTQFKKYLCSYRFPSVHPEFPFAAFMTHSEISAASPQVYWALNHNPVQQLVQCDAEYERWNKPVLPIGSTFGANFRVGESWQYWEPTITELEAFRKANVEAGTEKFYYYSLDWVLSHQKYDWLEAATGINDPDGPVVPPSIPPTYFTVSNCTWLNGRSDPDSSIDNRVVVVRAGEQVENLHEQSGPWRKVGLYPISCWMHGGYLE